MKRYPRHFGIKAVPLAPKKMVLELLSCDWPKRHSLKLVKRFPIAGLLRTEDKLYPDMIDYYSLLTPDHNPVIIVFHKGKKFIWDGNHRVHARLNKGLKTVRALVADLRCK